MSDERPMFEYERPAGPPPRWFFVMNIVFGVVFLWQHWRAAAIYERLGNPEGTLYDLSAMLLPVSTMTLGVSGLVKGPMTRKVVGAISLAAFFLSVVMFGASLLTE